MISLEIRFLTGRFHATAWQHAANEGVVEWPPSPWRLLRTLASAAYELDLVDAAKPLLAKLTAPPRYRLPPAQVAHTRHYMPDVEDAAHKRTKVFDNFVVVGGGGFMADPQPLTVTWNAHLSSEERALAARLAARVAYVGRAESWAEMRLAHDPDVSANCWPDEEARGASTRLMVLEPEASLIEWQRELRLPKGVGPAPESVWDVLTFDSGRYRREGWTKVPGTSFARYVFKENPFPEVRPSPRRRLSKRPTVARYAIRSAVLPMQNDALLVAERIRQALISRTDGKATFAGHAHDGTPLAGHRHAFILPACENNDAKRLDAITIYARDGFDDDDMRALRRLTVYRKGGHHLELVPLGFGTTDDYGGHKPGQTPVLATSRTWASSTPFVPTRHPKRIRGHWSNDFAAQVRLACTQLLGVEPIEVIEMPSPDWIHFRRRRIKGGGRRGPDRAMGFQLRFDVPVTGPIAIGFGAHLGLGAFVATQ